jgi:hypothetical protein
MGCGDVTAIAIRASASVWTRQALHLAASSQNSRSEACPDFSDQCLLARRPNLSKIASLAQNFIRSPVIGHLYSRAPVNIHLGFRRRR